MKTFVPTMVTDVHALAVYLARYGSTIRLAVAALQPEALLAYDAMVAAVFALDAYRSSLAPIDP